MKLTRFWVFNFIVSAVFGAMVAIPSLRMTRSAPGSHCYATIYELSSAIGSYNELEIMSGSNKTLVPIFTESPENIKQLNSIRSGLDHKFKTPRKPSDCNYGTIGDLTDKGIIVCLIHGSATDTPHIKDLEATFYSAEKGTFKQSGLTCRSEFYANLETEMRFAAAYDFTYVFLSVSVAMFIIYRVVLLLFWRDSH